MMLYAISDGGDCLAVVTACEAGVTTRLPRNHYVTVIPNATLGAIVHGTAITLTR